MAFDQTYFLSAPSQHDERTMRRAMFTATGGQSGVVGSHSLKVTATSTPSTQVVVAPGPFVVSAFDERTEHGYAGSRFEAYQATSSAPIHTSVVGTGSSSDRSDLVVARVDDVAVTQTGASRESGSRIEIIRGVPSTTTSTADLGNLFYPAVALARLDIPASTNTVTDAMITDLRQTVAFRSPAESMVTGSEFIPDTATFTPQNQGTWQQFTTGRQIYVPSWATHMTITGTLANLVVLGPDDQGGAVTLRFGLAGMSPSLSRGYGYARVASTASRWDRLNVPFAIDSIPLQDRFKGTMREVVGQGRREAPTEFVWGTREMMVQGIDNIGERRSQLIWTVFFHEKAE